MNNKNILITGGAGFIGSHTVNELINDNNIVIVDNFSTGNINNIDNPDHENLKIINEDIRKVNFDEVTKNIDYIFHFAAMASVQLSIENPLECYEINLDATVRLLNSAIKNNVKKVIFASSSSVYGDNNNLPLKESETLMPASPYAASKAGCELYLKTFHEDYGLEYVALRYFNIFGPKQDKNSPYAAVIPNFISAILEGETPIIYGDGEQSRDFVYIGDVVTANIRACESDFNGVINIASGKKLTINQLYDLIRNALGSDVEAEYQPRCIGDIKHSLADVSNMEKIGVKIDPDKFERDLIETVDWFKSIL